MTTGIKVNRPELLGKLVRRFRLLVMDNPDLQTLLETVQPITNIDDLLVLTRYDFADKDISGAANTRITYFTVPAGKRWKVHYLFKDASAGSTIVRFNSPDGPTQDVPTGPGSSAVITLTGIALRLPAAGTIQLQGTGNVGDTGVRLMIAYEEEDAF